MALAVESRLLSLTAPSLPGDRESPVHRLDPRAKILVAAAFATAVVSFDRYAVSPLVPFALYPWITLTGARIPARTVLKRMLPALPFALAVGIFNPLLDTDTRMTLGGLSVSGGWVSLASILLRVALTVSALVLLAATTEMPRLCHGLRRLGIPGPLAVQMLLLHRYLFVLVEEALRMLRARSLRTFGKRGLEMGTAASMLGHLLLRSILRAERIHHAMLARGFAGSFPVSERLRFRPVDAFHVCAWLTLFALCRFTRPVEWLGTMLAQGFAS